MSGENYGEIIQQKNPSKADIVNEMTALWKKYMSTRINPQDIESQKKYFDTVCKEEHPELFHSYNIVIKWIIFHQQYSIRAFDKYVKFRASNYPKDEEEFLEQQVKYLSLLYRELSGHNYNPKINAQMCADALAELKREAADFKRLLAEEEAKYNNDHERIIAEMRAKLANLAANSN